MRCSGLLLVFLLCLHSSLSHIGNVLDSLHSMLVYYNSNPETVDHNLIFGIILIKGQLGALKDLEDEEMENDVKELNKLCDQLLVKHPFDWTVTKHAKVLMESLGEKKKVPIKNELQSVPPVYNVLDNLETGSPSRTDSDTCLLGMLIDGEVLSQCETIEKDPNAKGYTLLHQTIFFTVKSHLLGDDAETTEIKRILCGRSLGESRQIMKMGFPLKLQDLFVEQVAVCGINKYQEFLTDGTLRMILSLQTSRGCFSFREKRKHLQSDCYTHLSAVSAAALAAFIV